MKQLWINFVRWLMRLDPEPHFEPGPCPELGTEFEIGLVVGYGYAENYDQT